MGDNNFLKNKKENLEYTKEMATYLREYTNSFTAYIHYSQLDMDLFREKLKQYPVPTFEKYYENSFFKKPNPEELKNSIFSQKIIKMNELAAEMNASDAMTAERYKAICDEVFEISDVTKWLE